MSLKKKKKSPWGPAAETCSTRALLIDLLDIAVLPTFKAEVSAAEKVIALTTNWIVVNTKAM